MQLDKDQNHILQLSDIHLGENYDGKFDTKDTFDRTVAHANSIKPNGGFDAVVITGDIADPEGPVENYFYVLKTAKTLCNRNGNIFVTPGNHDNREKLRQAYCMLTGNVADANELLTPGMQFKMAKVGPKTIVLIDTGDGVPYEGMLRLSRYAYDQSEHFHAADTLLFTHKPFKSEGNLYHRFMKDNMLPDKVSADLGRYIGGYFCGHLHHAARFDTAFPVYVAPGIQTQIDPYRKEFDSIVVPGYNIISFNTYSNSTVSVHTVFVED